MTGVRDISRDEKEKRRKIGKMYLYNKFKYIFFLLQTKVVEFDAVPLNHLLVSLCVSFSFFRKKVINNQHQIDLEYA